MREFEYEFAQGLQRGLRTHHKNPRNNEALLEAFNVRVGQMGLEEYVDLENGFTDQPTSDWPFPQLLVGSSHTVLVVRDTGLDALRLYEVGSDWSLTHLIDIDDLTYGEGGGLFTMAESGGFVVLANGRALVRRDPTTGEWNGYTVGAPYSTIPVVRSICNFKGQLVGGGVASSWHGCDLSSIVWGNIGSESFVLDRRNEAGFRRLPRGGEVFRVLRLGDVVVVYSDREVLALSPVAEPAPTFKTDEMVPLGLAGPGAVGGTIHEHLFVDNAGWLWKLSANNKIERLGYQEFMTGLTAQDIVISYDPVEKEYYISDSNRCFLYTGYGLTEVHQLVSGAGLVNGTRTGLWREHGDLSARVVLDTLDFGMRGLNTIETMEFGLTTPAKAEAAIRWRAERRKDMLQSPWREVNAQGAVALPVSGSDFQVCLRASNFENFTLDYLKLRWKMTDLRTLRGVYAPPSSARGQR